MPLQQLQLPEGGAAYAETHSVPATAGQAVSMQTTIQEAEPEAGAALQQAQQQIIRLQAEVRRLRTLLHQIEAESCAKEAQLREKMSQERELRRQLCLLSARPARCRTEVFSLTTPPPRSEGANLQFLIVEP